MRFDEVKSFCEKQIKEMYDVDMSDSLLSRIIDKILPEIKQWQNRSLETIYPIVYMDAMVFKIKEERGKLMTECHKKNERIGVL